MEVVLWDYPDGIVLQEGESPNHAILRAEEEGISHTQQVVDHHLPKDVTPGKESLSYKYILHSRREKPVIDMKPQREDAQGLVTDKRGNTIISITGKKRISLDPEQRSYFPILEQSSGALCLRRIVFVSLIHQ